MLVGECGGKKTKKIDKRAMCQKKDMMMNSLLKIMNYYERDIGDSLRRIKRRITSERGKYIIDEKE